MRLMDSSAVLNSCNFGPLSQAAEGWRGISNGWPASLLPGQGSEAGGWCSLSGWVEETYPHEIKRRDLSSDEERVVIQG